jgi:hypothetical protein
MAINFLAECVETIAHNKMRTISVIQQGQGSYNRGRYARFGDNAAHGCYGNWNGNYNKYLGGYGSG